MSPLTLARFAAGLPPHRARKVLAVALACAEAQSDPLAAARRACAEAWERDMQPVRSAMAAALHAGGKKPLVALRRLLAGLLREVNRTPALASALLAAMAAFIADPPIVAAAITLDESPAVTEAMQSWRRREVFETDLGSAELRGFSQELRNRSIFSARTTNAEYLREVAATVDDILAGKLGMAQGRLRLMRKLKELGYDPAVGFPEDMALVPPAERGSLQDLSSARRIDLLLETNVRMAHGYSQHVAGNGEAARYAYPAWELKRLYHREVPRGSAESKTTGWETRWQDAAESVGWEGVSREAFEQGQLIALKSSPLWQALGDGVGGYTDTLLNPFPVFAFRSGKAWVAVSRDRVIALGLIRAGEDTPQAAPATLEPKHAEMKRILDGMPADLRAELERELAAS